MPTENKCSQKALNGISINDVFRELIVKNH